MTINNLKKNSNYNAISFVFVLQFLFISCAQKSDKIEAPSFKTFKSSLAEKKNRKKSELDPNCKTKICQGLRQEFRYVIYVGKEIYCYWSEKIKETKTDFKSLSTQLENSINDQTSLTDYLVVLQHWAAAFHDGHVNVLPQDLEPIEIFSAPIRLEIFAPATDHEKVIVVKVNNISGVSVGDELLGVDGLPINEVLNVLEKKVSGSTARMRRYNAARKIVDALGTQMGNLSLEIQIKKSNGTVSNLSIFRNIELEEPTAQNSHTPFRPLLSYLPAVKILPGGIGYMRIDGFSGDKAMQELFSKALDRMKATKGLILDLRRNGGGDLSGDAILSRLTSKNIIRYKRSEKINNFILNSRPNNFFLNADSNGDFAAWRDLIVKPAEADKLYKAPVVSLISPYCFSACDTFVASLKSYKLATLIGEGTGGGTGTPLVFDLPISKFKFRYSVIRGKTPDGVDIEGLGTLPDLYKEPVVSDRMQEYKDSQIDYAVSVLNGKLSPIDEEVQDNLVEMDNSNQNPSSALVDVNNSNSSFIDMSPTRFEFKSLQQIQDLDEN